MPYTKKGMKRFPKSFFSAIYAEINMPIYSDYSLLQKTIKHYFADKEVIISGDNNAQKFFTKKQFFLNFCKLSLFILQSAFFVK